MAKVKVGGSKAGKGGGDLLSHLRDQPLDRDELVRELEEEQARAARSSGRVQWITEKVTNLRIVPFWDGEKVRWHRKVVYHREPGKSGKVLGLCLKEMKESNCAFCAAEEAARAEKKETRTKRQFRYLVNAIDIDEKEPKVQIWELPSTVWQGIMAMLTGKWQNLVSIDKGHCVEIVKSGSGLDTSYAVNPDPEPYPVGEEFVAQIAEPLTAVEEDSVEKQCRVLGTTAEALWGDDAPAEEPEEAPEEPPEEEEEPAEEPEEPPEEPAEEEDGVTVEVGDTVLVDVEGKDRQGKILKFNPEGTLAKIDVEGRKPGWYSIKDISVPPDEEPEEEEKPRTARPKCFGQYDAADAGCKGCPTKADCKKATAHAEGGAKKGKKGK